MNPSAGNAPPPLKSKVLLVDDHPIVLTLLSQLIAQEDDLYVCAAAGDVAHAMTAVEEHHPDLAILDINLPDGHGLELIKEIQVRHPDVRMLVFSTHDERLYGARALRAGAQGYLMKSEPPEKLIMAIRSILDGKLAVSAELSQRLMADAAHKKRPEASAEHLLSDRELEVFELIGSGLSTKEIAGRLNRGVKTIDTYRLRIKEKLQITTVTDLVAKAARWVMERQ